MKYTCKCCGEHFEFNGGKFDDRVCPSCGFTVSFVQKSYNTVYDDDGNEMPVACQFCSRDAYPMCVDNCIN